MDEAERLECAEIVGAFYLAEIWGRRQTKAPTGRRTPKCAACSCIFRAATLVAVPKTIKLSRDTGGRIQLRAKNENP